MKACTELWRIMGNATLLAAAFLFSEQAGAATLTVESFADNLGNPFTLRTKISQAHDGDTIVFSPALDGFTITLLNGELLIANSLTIIGPTNANLSIVGGNVSNPLKKRVFHITAPPMNTRTVDISGLQIQGSIVGTNGADGNAISPASAGGAPTNGGGGAIFCDINTVLVVSNCYFSSCHAVGGKGGNAYDANCVRAGQGGPGGPACGGAIYSLGDCFLFNSTFYSNTAVGGDGGTGAQGGVGGDAGWAKGGALCIGYHHGFDLMIINCTFSGNVASGGNGGAGGGGFICTIAAKPANGGTGGTGGPASGGGMDIDQNDIPATGSIHSSVYRNYCSPGAGGTGGPGVFGGNAGGNGTAGSATGCGLNVANQPIPIGNTLFADNHALPNTLPAMGPDVYGNVLSKGFNLITAADNGGPWLNNDRRGSMNAPLNALVGTFPNTIGNMPTFAPLQGSPAIDAGTQMNLPLDQIGQTRPVLASGAVNGGDGSDIGAFEVQCSATSGSPVLDIRLTGASLIVSWPAPSFCYVLQQSPDLVNWVNSAFQVKVLGAQNQVTINPAPPGPIFFRLIHL